MTARNSASHAERPQQPQKRIWLQAGISHLGWIQAVEIKPSAKPRSRQCRSSSCHQWPRTNALLPLDQGWVLQPSGYVGRSTTKHPLVPVPAIRAHLAPLLMIALTSGPSQPDHRSRPGTKKALCAGTPGRRSGQGRTCATLISTANTAPCLPAGWSPGAWWTATTTQSEKSLHRKKKSPL